MKLNFDVTAKEFEIIREILEQNLPADAKVWVFGSRAKHKAKFNSDIDLAIETCNKLPVQTVIQLEEAFDESLLPYKVDCVDVHDIEPYFKEIIDSHKVVFPMSFKQDVPELRFPGFRDAWQPKRLDSLASIQRGKFSPRPRNNPIYYGGEIPFVQTGDVFNSKGRITQNTQTLNEEGLKVSRLFPQGTILITIAANIGYSGVLEMDCACPDSLIGIGVKENSVNYFINYALTRKQSEMDYKADNNAQKNINLEFLKPYQLIVPKKEEQQKIADFLSSVDKKIEQLSEKHALLLTYKKGVMQQLFSQQIRFKDDHGNDYPEWITTQLKQIAKINPRASSLPDLFTYIDLESVEQGRLVKKALINIEDAPSRAQRCLQANDILFQMVRPYQKNNYFFKGGSNFVASTGYAQIRYDEAPKFLYYTLHLHSFVNRVMALCTGTSYPAINTSDLGTIKITIPSDLQEQQKIANFLTELDHKIEQVQASLEQAQTFKKGLSQKMFV